MPTATFAVAIACFVLGRPLYKLKPVEGSAVVSFLRALRSSVWRGRGLLLLAGAPLAVIAFAVVVASFFVRYGPPFVMHHLQPPFRPHLSPPSTPLNPKVPDGPLHDGLAIAGLALILLSLALLIGCGVDTAWLSASRAGQLEATSSTASAQALLPATTSTAAARADAADVVRPLPHSHPHLRCTRHLP